MNCWNRRRQNIIVRKETVMNNRLKRLITYNEMVDLFEKSNARFLKRDRSLFINQVSERTLCGALMLHIDRILRDDQNHAGYYVDVEYNRNAGAIKTICKTIKGPGMKVIRINCDLIVHSRGEITKQDNLIAIEMKKSTAPKMRKDKDRERYLKNKQAKN